MSDTLPKPAWQSLELKARVIQPRRMGPRENLICGQVFIDIGLTRERLTNELIRQRTGSAGSDSVVGACWLLNRIDKTV